MAPAAKLVADAAHPHGAHVFRVLLAEERHGASGARLVKRFLRKRHRDILADVFIYQAFDIFQALALDALEVREVEAQPVRPDPGAGLVHVVAEHILERRLQQVRGRVVIFSVAALVGVDARGHFVALAQLAAVHLHQVGHQLSGTVFRAGDEGIAGR